MGGARRKPVPRSRGRRSRATIFPVTMKTTIGQLLGLVIPRVSGESTDSKERQFYYRRLWTYLVLLISFVSISPLIIMSYINHHLYTRSFQSELRYYASNLTLNAKRQLEGFLDKHKKALTMAIYAKSFNELNSVDELERTLDKLNASFGRFVDLGLIDENGDQHSYVGPYQFMGRNYASQSWFKDVVSRGVHVSEVFMGYRNLPHFVIALKQERPEGGYYIVRATIDTAILNEIVSSVDLRPSCDAFIVTPSGILQTPSRVFGNILEPCRIDDIPFDSPEMTTLPVKHDGKALLIGYAPVQDSPFIFVVVQQSDDAQDQWWTLHTSLLGFLAVSILLGLVVIFWSTTYVVNRLRQTDLEHAELLAKVQYTNKMASIGRLAAGVAHEVNNPLAIISEKAGLLEDLALLKDDFTYRDKTLEIVRSILKTVRRCSEITHRLLGFAKRVDPKYEPIELEQLIRDVLGFLGKEIEYRNIAVAFHVEDALPEIRSDRGQLQQVFINIINNAFDAMLDYGRLDIHIRAKDPEQVEIAIQDNGAGIAPEHLKNIFEPFFTTKKEYGTGLGLSITYGIVQKLGGQILLDSEVGVGTRFTLVFPIAPPGLAV
jgi:signal transduction histidine kinase